MKICLVDNQQVTLAVIKNAFKHASLAEAIKNEVTFAEC